MKLICEKEKILKALNSVTKAVAVRTTMPILEGILIQTNDNEIKLTTYDLDIGIEYIINDCKVEEQGATVVNAIMFTEIIRRLPDTDIKITINDKNLLVIECDCFVIDFYVYFLSLFQQTYKWSDFRIPIYIASKA
jgi:DNA polymerase-3 subunit beta